MMLTATIQAILDELSDEERQNLKKWLEELIAIRESSAPRRAKLKAAYYSLDRSASVWPIVRNLAQAIKRTGWDQRKGGFKAFVAGSAGGLLLFGFQGAGIAALGGAIGLPLWIVLGGGVSVAHAILSELRDPEQK